LASTSLSVSLEEGRFLEGDGSGILHLVVVVVVVVGVAQAGRGVWGEAPHK